MSAAPSARGVGCEAAAGAVPLRVLQCGYSKSGNYLLHRVLSSLLEAHGHFRSFVAASGVGAAIDALCGATRRMPDARRVDNLKLVDGAWHVQFPDLRCRFLPVDWSLVLAHSTLVWSHDRPDDLVPYEDDFSHRIYILRDGRDVVNSMLHYLVTPAILALYPDHRFETLEQIYADLDFFAGKVVAWRDHVRSLGRHAGRWRVVRFEELAEERARTIDGLARHLGLAADAGALAEERARTIDGLARHLGLSADVSELAAATDFAAMRRSAPRHLREGRRGDWQRWFGPRHRDVFKELAGRELIELGYADSLDW